MSKMLSHLVGVSEQLFALSVKQLEQASGNPGVDISLSAEIIERINVHIKALGLDPNDTTGEELYYALNDLARLHDQFLVKRIGGTNQGDVADLVPRIVHFADKINVPKSTWAIKHSVVKKILKDQPPKKVMKQLGYRSIDSMLKREKVDELLVGTRVLESAEWQNKLVNSYKKLTPADFESRDVRFIILEGQKWGTEINSYVKQNHQNITHLKELGVIAVLPLPVNHLDGVTLALILRIMYYLNEVRAYGSYFKLKQVKANFGQIITDAIINDPARHAVMAGQHIHWRVIHRYYGSAGVVHGVTIFEPHLNSDDLFWRKAEEALYKVEPALQFWHDMDFVGLDIDNQPISFNLMDVSANLVNKTAYGDHFNGYLKDALMNELFIRYLASESLRNQVNRQLDVTDGFSELGGEDF